ncbi:ABC transporter permease [Mangrovicoccus sp. HB161399]|uniref:ABC transporter permease n=1 Tax=Mangrovicoccus sp. HB161399 TaxID=2720392 RepID=UPI00352D2082
MSDLAATLPPGPARVRRSVPGFALLPVPALVLVGIGLILPLGLIARYSLAEFDPADIALQGLTAGNYLKFFGDPFYREVLGRTLAVAAGSTAACLLLGVPAAYAISRARSARLRSALLLLAIVPLLMGNAVRALGWMVLLSERGIVNQALTGLGLADAPVRLMYTPLAVTLSLVAVLLPFMVLTLQSVFDSISPVYEDAAATMGAPPWAAFRHVFLPLAMPGLFSGSLLVFILGMNAYASPVLLGGPAFHMMAPMVYEQAVEAFNWPFASALAFVLMAATLVLTVLSSRVLQKRYGRL